MVLAENKMHREIIQPIIQHVIGTNHQKPGSGCTFWDTKQHRTENKPQQVNFKCRVKFITVYQSSVGHLDKEKLLTRTVICTTWVVPRILCGGVLNNEDRITETAFTLKYETAFGCEKNHNKRFSCLQYSCSEKPWWIICASSQTWNHKAAKSYI